MGKTKQLLPFGKTTLLGEVVSNARCSMLYEVIVVLGYHADEINKAIDFSGTKVVLNHGYAQGQSSSIVIGLENVSPDCDAAMFLLCDQPFITCSVIDLLVEAFKGESDHSIVIPCFNGKQGNPVIIGRSLFDILMSLSGDTGARVLFSEFEDSILKVPVNNHAVLIDVDTKDDYNKIKRFF